MHYSLTEKGMGIYSITLALMAWGDQWLAGAEGPPLLLQHEACGHRLRPVACCAHCAREVDPRDITFEAGPGARGSAARRPPARREKKRGA